MNIESNTVEITEQKSFGMDAKPHVSRRDYLFSNQLSMFGKREIIGFGSNEFFIREIDRNVANKIIKKHHYSKRIVNASYIHLGCFIKNEMLGVLQFGAAMNPASGKNIIKNTENDEFCELNRMWFDDKAERNTESMALSYSVKFIRAKYKKIKWIQSFADERCGGFGIVYQAANFKYFGEHISSFYELDGETYHKQNIMCEPKKGQPRYEYFQKNIDRAVKMSFRQFRYIYFINQKCIKDCLLKEQPYPKHYAVV